MDRRTFYKRNGDVISYTQLEFLKEKSAVVIKTGIRGGKHEIERKVFDDAMPALDLFLELNRKYKEEDRCYPFPIEIKFTMNLERKKNDLSKEKFKDFLESIYCTVDDYFWETINGGISGGIKKIKGTLYAIRVNLIDKDLVQELLCKLIEATENAKITVSEGQEKMFTQIPEYTGAKDLELEIWMEDGRGFIFVTITLGEHVFETRFSGVWNPTEDLRKWLEAICVGVEECAFAIQNEGEDTKFNFRNWGTDRCVFFAGWDRNEMNIVAHVNRYQFVKTFYNAYLSLLDPDFFTDTKNWDADLASKFNSKIIEEYLQSDEKSVRDKIEDLYGVWADRWYECGKILGKTGITSFQYYQESYMLYKVGKFLSKETELTYQEQNEILEKCQRIIAETEPDW